MKGGGRLENQGSAPPFLMSHHTLGIVKNVMAFVKNHKKPKTAAVVPRPPIKTARTTSPLPPSESMKLQNSVTPIGTMESRNKMVNFEVRLGTKLLMRISV